MANVIKLKSSNIFWTGKEDAVWSDKLEDAAKFEDLENAELEIEDWSSEVYSKLARLEKELDDYKMEIDLPDEEWDEDENL
jgi:hypothetical protein